MVRAGMTALAPGTRATAEDMDLALDLFRAVGRAEVVAETHLDAVTALSGSGPAFVAVFLEALADGAVKWASPGASPPIRRPDRPRHGPARPRKKPAPRSSQDLVTSPRRHHHPRPPRPGTGGLQGRGHQRHRSRHLAGPGPGRRGEVVCGRARAPTPCPPPTPPSQPC